MLEKAQIFTWKTRSKISFDYTWLLRGKNIARLDDAFSGIFELEASAAEGQSLQQKDKREIFIVLPFLGFQSKVITQQLKSCIYKFYGCFNVKIIFRNTAELKSN